ncbi:MAG: hypothetical protein JO159_17735 [Acidobacteria bacterium]|nr:hypothetical protein [Acidobacteriota bacterium]
MPDSLHLSLWFRDFSQEKMLASALRVIEQFSASMDRPGITNIALHPISWNEPTILERRFRPGVSPQEAVVLAADLLHEDYAYVFEANWDLWTPETVSGSWVRRPTAVNFIVRGEEFEDGESKVEGEIEVDFGLDTPFLYEGQQLTQELDSRIRANVQTLVDFVHRAEKHSGAVTRLLWSESDENLAQKLVSRLQRTQ